MALTAAGDDPFLRSITILPVADIEQSAAWYEHAIGTKTTYLHKGEDESEPTNYAILRRGRLVVHLHSGRAAGARVLDPGRHRQALSHRPQCR